MGGIHGIGGLPEPINLNSAPGRARRSDDRPSAAASADSVQVSSEGANLSRLSGLSDQIDAQRAERIAQARENLEKGTHQILEVVEVVASRISKFIDAE